MTPLVVLVVSTLVLRLVGFVGVAALATWRDAVRVGLAVMFVFTGCTHFTGMKHDYAAMVPPPFTGQLWVIHLTGALEIAGAVGLLVRRTRRLAAICLMLLLVAMFPANIHAAVHGVEFRGAPPTDVWLRALVQLVFLFTVWWSVLARPRVPSPRLQPAA